MVFLVMRREEGEVSKGTLSITDNLFFFLYGEQHKLNKLLIYLNLNFKNSEENEDF